MRHELHTFQNMPAGSGTSGVLNVRDLVDKWVQVTNGNRTATIEGTLDGVTWIAIDAVLASTNELVEVPQAVTQIRITISAHAAGATTAILAGRNART